MGINETEGMWIMGVLSIGALVIFYYRYINGMEFNPIKYAKNRIADMKISRELAILQEKNYQQQRIAALEKIKGDEQ